MFRCLSMVLLCSVLGYAINGDFYKKYKEGYYSYEEDISDDNTSKKPKRVINDTYLNTLNVKQLKDLREEIKEIAILSHNKQDIDNYIKIQNFIISKSEGFQKAYNFALLNDASLDISSNVPSNLMTNSTDLKIKDRKRKEFFHKPGRQVGFIVYFDNRDGVEKLKSQMKVAEAFKRDFAAETLFVDITGDIEIRKKKSMGQTPDIWLVIKNEDGRTSQTRVASGLSTMPTILQNLDFLIDYYKTNGANDE